MIIVPNSLACQKGEGEEEGEEEEEGDQRKGGQTETPTLPLKPLIIAAIFE